jgi:hypothetical protein
MQSMSENDFECFASTGVAPPMAKGSRMGKPEVIGELRSDRPLRPRLGLARSTGRWQAARLRLGRTFNLQ